MKNNYYDFACNSIRTHRYHDCMHVPENDVFFMQILSHFEIQYIEFLQHLLEQVIIT